MHPFFHIGKLTIPGYGMMIALGVVLANVIALLLLKKYRLDFNDLMILEAYAFLGGFGGAKLLYLLVSYKTIEWRRFFEPEYFNELMLAGFVFYGGLIGGVLIVLLAGRIHKISTAEYIRRFIFLIPFIHGFGRLGCHLAGCCYGMPYDGPLAIVCPEGSFGLSGVSLFPIQLTEAVFLIIISLTIFILQFTVNWPYCIETYFLLYGILRFIIENYRYDAERGIFLGLSTSQWISLGIILAAIIIFTFDKKYLKEQKENEN